MGEIFARTEALDMLGKIAISHAFALGAPNQARTQALIDQVAALDIAILTTGAPSAQVPMIPRLREVGIRVGAGCDGIRDTWGPWGKPDMPHRANVIGMRNGFRRDEDFEYALHGCSTGGAKVIGLPGHRLAVGDPADLCLTDAMTLAHAVADTVPQGRPRHCPQGRDRGTRRGNPVSALADLPLGRRPSGRTVLRATWVLAHDGASHRLIPDGEVVIEGLRVLWAGRRFEGEVARRVDFGHALISLGLIDLDALSDVDTILSIDH